MAASASYGDSASSFELAIQVHVEDAKSQEKFFIKSDLTLKL